MFERTVHADFLDRVRRLADTRRIENPKGNTLQYQIFLEHIARRSGDIRYNRLFLSGQQIQKRRFSGIRLSKNNCLDALLDHLTLIRRCQELFHLFFLLRNNHGQPLRVSVQTDVLRVIKRRLDKRDLINQLLANCPDRLFHRSAQLALGAF